MTGVGPNAGTGTWADVHVNTFPLHKLVALLDVRERLSVAQVCSNWRKATLPLWKTLDLCCVKDDAPKWLEMLAAHKHRFTQLQRIKIEFCNAMQDANLQHLRGLPSVTSLLLNACQELTGQGIGQLLPSMPNLTELEVYWNLNVRDDLLFSASAYLPRLERINLSGCKEVTDDGVKILAASCPSLTDLDLTRGMRLTDSSIKAIAKNLPALQSLNCYACSWLTDPSLRALGAGCPELRFLDICGAGRVTDAAVEALASGCHRLTSLNLTWCVLLTDSAVISIAKGCPKLELLSLHGILGITDSAVEALSENCAKTLVALDVHGCTAITRFTTHKSLRAALPALTCHTIHK
eukprot:jgi/Tetstr1/456802/TSEL_043476.t1